MVDVPKRVVEVFSFFLSFSFLVLVFGLWFLTVALLAWRVAFCGLGWGSLYNMGKVFFALDWTTLQVHVTFFLLMRWEEGTEGYGRAAASGRFLLEIENRQKSATVGLGVFFVFYEVGW